MNNDLISRSALLAALVEGGILPAKVRWMIERAPSVDAVPVRWIPVTEKMPDNEVDVLICVERRHYSDPGKFIRFVVKAFHTDGQHNTEDSDYAWTTDYMDKQRILILFCSGISVCIGDVFGGEDDVHV